MNFIKKTILLLIALIFVLISCDKGKGRKNIGRNLSCEEVSKSTKQLLFDNELRRENGVTTVDSLKFDEGCLKNNRITFDKFSTTNLNSNEIFKIEFNLRDSLILDSYLIGKDSVMRMQSRLKKGKYLKDDLAVILITSNSNRLLLLDEILTISSRKKIYNEKDSLFYGLRINRYPPAQLRDTRQKFNNSNL